MLDDRITNMRRSRGVFVQVLLLNLLVALAKLICGFLSNTLSMVADGFHSLLDAASNVIGVVGLSIAVQPPDKGHPYGHTKFEALAAVAISFMMFLACLNVLSGVFDRVILRSETHPSVSWISYVVMFGSGLVNVLVTAYEKRKAKTLQSRLLLADSEHTLSDLYVSMSVVIALLAAQFHVYIVDVIASIVIVSAIFYAGIGIIRTHLGSLVDAAVLDPREVERLVMQVPNVTSCHKIRSRGMHDHIFVDLRVHVPPHLTVAEAHEVASAIEAGLKEYQSAIIEAVVHVEEEGHADHDEVG